MEKREAKIKCNGCGSSYKLKIPVTDKPVSFKCKNCGKVLKIKLKAAEPKPAPPPEDEFSFETTQLPDTYDYQDQSTPAGAGPEIEGHSFEAAAPVQTKAEATKARHWLVMGENDEVIKGPYTEDEVRSLILDGEILPDMRVKAGERPWNLVSNMQMFRVTLEEAGHHGFGGSFTLEESKQERNVPLLNQLLQLPAYPLSGGPIPFAITAGACVILSILLALDFLIGLPLNLIGWTVLYGYLYRIMQGAKQSSNSPPPAWDPKTVTAGLASGGKVLGTVLFYTGIPVSILLLGMIYGFINEEHGLGWGLMTAVVLVYIASLFPLAASLANLNRAGSLTAALNPVSAVSLLFRAGASSITLAAVTAAVGVLILTIIILSVYVTDIPLGFVPAGILLGLILAYGHIIWFYVIGRFTAETANLPPPAPKPPRVKKQKAAPKEPKPAEA